MRQTPVTTASRASAFIPLFGTATAFVALLVLACAVGIGAMMAMM